MKKKINWQARAGQLVRNNSVPIMFILICAVCIPLSGFSPATCSTRL